MEPHKPPPRPRHPEGCLTVAIRVPVRIAVLVLVVPVRMGWDALVVTGRFLRDTVLRPLGRALLWVGKALFVWPFVALWRHVLVPVGRALGRLGTVLVVVPALWCRRYVLTPVGHALAWLARGAGAGLAWVYARVLSPIGHAVARLARCLLVVPARWLYDRVLTPAGRALARCVRGLGQLLGVIGTGIGVALYWTLRVLLFLPALALWRWVLAPVGRFLAVVAREIGDALGHAWRIAGRISRAVGRALGTLFRWILVEPVRWVHRTVLTPVGHLVRDAVLRPAAEGARVLGRAVREALAGARDTVRQARADFRRMVFGEPRPQAAVDRREPQGPAARTLGSSTTALTKD
ncbi:hypothetical protein [Streptomyces barringtoniae]|uniref:hypothetical protein n=1 Tax=Streptomyces barringtoniae TaxID=2892029 RepID=UPI001E53654C|nr:hypothetical protein [Streptomyces barringtoniae]MCC5481245.1 hypothetical protein [Streptomyces barringtoniae]